MPLLVALDAGNTNTVLGFFEGERLVATARVTTNRDRTADEHVLLLRELLSAKRLSLHDVADVIVASVVPSQDYSIRAACRDAFGKEPLFVAPGVKTGMKILYDHPAEVGADRIVNAVAAFAEHGGPCIVVDFGTATTFDVVTKSGDYLGGVICPGPRISADALFSRAARLSRVDLLRPDRVIGKTTIQSVQSGLFWGVVASAEGIIARIRAELAQASPARETPSGRAELAQASPARETPSGRAELAHASPAEDAVRVVTTGGLAPLFAAASPDLAVVDADLTLKGLRLLYERNRPS